MTELTEDERELLRLVENMRPIWTTNNFNTILAHYRKAKAEAVHKDQEVMRREDWDEKHGAVLWWRFPVVEPPYCGTPLDDDFPGYWVTHWTRLRVPSTDVEKSHFVIPGEEE